MANKRLMSIKTGSPRLRIERNAENLGGIKGKI
jgi:hypothetical protein